MATTHSVRQGESLISLSKRYGIPVDKIINHSDNRRLRERKRNEGILFPGDRITIPDREIREIDGSTEQRHRFRYKTGNARLKLRLLKEDEPRANEPYRLIIEGRDLRGNLDNEGRLEVQIPADAHQAVLMLGERGEEKIALRIGNLDPVEEARGVQQRLNNLGFYCGAEEDRLTAGAETALKLFQSKHGLEPTGRIDDATKNRLQEVHGS